ncbi:unnamed protein product [Cladocopium goreaui]|uniref:N-acetyl-gamma-glutamyl-phosphate reductase n=1 Tax=Cladocopium goreaui TaxID=2562237 RepID=A0A9P1FJ71_9DINO|nr:unnamed protein product [Cladocopium goreaui]
MPWPELPDEEAEKLFAEVFPDSSKLDAYAMALDDIQVFEEAGHCREHVGKLATYGFVNFTGMRTLLKGIASKFQPGALVQEALAGRRFLDLGSGDGRAVIAAAVIVPSLSECVGVELSMSRHQLAAKNRSRLPEKLKEIVRFDQCDIMQVPPVELGRMEIVWLANLRFPDETVASINEYLETNCAREVNAVVATLRECHFRRPNEMWTEQVSMSWNPAGWQVFCYYLPMQEKEAAQEIPNNFCQ